MRPILSHSEPGMMTTLRSKFDRGIRISFTTLDSSDDILLKVADLSYFYDLNLVKILTGFTQKGPFNATVKDMWSNVHVKEPAPVGYSAVLSAVTSHYKNGYELNQLYTLLFFAYAKNMVLTVDKENVAVIKDPDPEEVTPHDLITDSVRVAVLEVVANHKISALNLKLPLFSLAVSDHLRKLIWDLNECYLNFGEHFGIIQNVLVGYLRNQEMKPIYAKLGFKKLLSSTWWLSYCMPLIGENAFLDYSEYELTEAINWWNGYLSSPLARFQQVSVLDKVAEMEFFNFKSTHGNRTFSSFNILRKSITSGAFFSSPLVKFSYYDDETIPGYGSLSIVEEPTGLVANFKKDFSLYEIDSLIDTSIGELVDKMYTNSPPNILTLSTEEPKMISLLALAKSKSYEMFYDDSAGKMVIYYRFSLNPSIDITQAEQYLGTDPDTNYFEKTGEVDTTNPMLVVMFSGITTPSKYYAIGTQTVEEHIDGKTHFNFADVSGSKYRKPIVVSNPYSRSAYKEIPLEGGSDEKFFSFLIPELYRVSSENQHARFLRNNIFYILSAERIQLWSVCLTLVSQDPDVTRNLHIRILNKALATVAKCQVGPIRSRMRRFFKYNDLSMDIAARKSNSIKEDLMFADLGMSHVYPHAALPFGTSFTEIWNGLEDSVKSLLISARSL